jgi:hypothetical protein
MNVIIKNEAPDVASSVDEKIRWIGELVFEEF